VLRENFHISNCVKQKGMSSYRSTYSFYGLKH